MHKSRIIPFLFLSILSLSFISFESQAADNKYWMIDTGEEISFDITYTYINDTDEDITTGTYVFKALDADYDADHSLRFERTGTYYDQEVTSQIDTTDGNDVDIGELEVLDKTTWANYETELDDMVSDMKSACSESSSCNSITVRKESGGIYYEASHTYQSFFGGSYNVQEKAKFVYKNGIMAYSYIEIIRSTYTEIHELEGSNFTSDMKVSKTSSSSSIDSFLPQTLLIATIVAVGLIILAKRQKIRIRRI